MFSSATFLNSNRPPRCIHSTERHGWIAIACAPQNQTAGTTVAASIGRVSALSVISLRRDSHRLHARSLQNKRFRNAKIAAETAASTTDIRGEPYFGTDAATSFWKRPPQRVNSFCGQGTWVSSRLRVCQFFKTRVLAK
jgi:hypothetical protein